MSETVDGRPETEEGRLVGQWPELVAVDRGHEEVDGVRPEVDGGADQRAIGHNPGADSDSDSDGPPSAEGPAGGSTGGSDGIVDSGAASGVGVANAGASAIDGAPAVSPDVEGAEGFAAGGGEVEGSDVAPGAEVGAGAEADASWATSFDGAAFGRGGSRFSRGW